MTIRTNLTPNPRPISTTFWLPYYGTGGIGTTTFPTTGGPTTRYGRMTWTTAPSDAGGNWSNAPGGNAQRAATVPGQAYTASVYIRASQAVQVMPVIHWHNAAGTELSATTGASVLLVANVWTRLSVVNATAPALAVFAGVDMRRNSTPNAIVGATLDVADLLIEQLPSVDAYFDGVTPPAAGWSVSWTGTADQSTSVAATAAITAAAVSAEGRVQLTIDPSTTGSVNIFRRDSLGVSIVRASYSGLAVVAGVQQILSDYEPRQGETTDYLLTTLDGVPLASATITIPTWGTWLKSPSRPWLNVLTALGDESDEKLPANRQIVRIEGAQRAIALTGVRFGSEGALQLAVRTVGELDDVRAILADGDTIMIDVAPAWGVTYRYVSVGDVQIERHWHELGMEKQWRGVKLDQLVELDTPLGPLDVAIGMTYNDLPTMFASYAAIPSTVASYDALTAL